MALLFSGQAWAQMACGPDVQQTLAEKYGEAPVVSGVGDNGESIMTFYANRKTGTWTVAVRHARRPDIDCVVATGAGWWQDEEKPRDDPA